MRSERWSTAEEVKRELTPSGLQGRGGPVLYCQNGKNWVYPNEGHSLILGVSGSGKSRRGTIPLVRNIIAAGDSGIVVDPKGEIYYQTAYAAEGKYVIHKVNFRDVFCSERWNPLGIIQKLYYSEDISRREKAMELIEDLAHSLYPIHGSEDPFWPEAARTVFIGAVCAVLELAKPEEVNMTSVYKLIADGQKKFGGSTVLQTAMEALPPDSVAAMMLESYVSGPHETRASITSVFLTGISIFARSEGLKTMMSKDELDIYSLDAQKPTLIYIILPDETSIFDSLAGILCSQILGHYMCLAQEKYGGRLPRRMNVILEELGNIGGAISHLPHWMTASRSRNIRIHLVLQSLSQLSTLYGAAQATTIMSNADVMVAFRINHWETLTELSNKCGEREVRYGNSASMEKLITPTQLAAMVTGQALVMISGRIKFITWLPDFTQMYDTSDWRAPKAMQRRYNQKQAIFDVCSFTKEFHRNKLMRMMQEDEREPPKHGLRFFEDGIHIPAKNTAGEAIGREEKKHPSSEEKKKPCTLEIMSVPSGKLKATTESIWLNTDMTRAEVQKMLKSLPCTVQFINQELAHCCYTALKASGTDVRVKEAP